MNFAAYRRIRNMITYSWQSKKIKNQIWYSSISHKQACKKLQLNNIWNKQAAQFFFPIIQVKAISPVDTNYSDIPFIESTIYKRTSPLYTQIEKKSQICFESRPPSHS